MGVGSLKDLYLDELGMLYDAEVQMIRTLPRLSEAANAPELRETLTTHCRESRLHIERIDLMFTHWGERRPLRSSPGLAGIVQEADERLNQEATPEARSWALRLNRWDEARLLQETLDEVGRADDRLTAIARAHLAENSSTV